MNKNVLIIVKGLIHPSLPAKITFKTMLLNLDKKINYTVRTSIKDLQILNRGTFDAVILYYHLKEIDAFSLRALIKFAEKGGGVLVLHSAMASFKNNARYKDFVGGRFREHGRIEEITIFPTDNDHPVTKDIKSFSVKDELYIHDYDSDNTILMTANNKGLDEPALWVKEYGSGRICYFAPGHCANVWLNEEVRNIIGNALEWLLKSEDK